MESIKLILDQEVVDKYNNYYFTVHPKAKKKAIDRPILPSINTWCILPRIQMNALKQKWCDFIVWWINDLGIQNTKLDKFILEVKAYMGTKRRADIDNFTCLKFANDGFTKSGFIIDDDYKHETYIFATVGYDKENPRTEFTFYILENQKDCEELKEWKLNTLVNH